MFTKRKSNQSKYNLLSFHSKNVSMLWIISSLKPVSSMPPGKTTPSKIAANVIPLITTFIYQCMSVMSLNRSIYTEHIERRADKRGRPRDLPEGRSHSRRSAGRVRERALQPVGERAEGLSEPDLHAALRVLLGAERDGDARDGCTRDPQRTAGPRARGPAELCQQRAARRRRSSCELVHSTRCAHLGARPCRCRHTGDDRDRHGALGRARCTEDEPASLSEL